MRRGTGWRAGPGLFLRPEKEAELAALREDSQQLQKLRAEQEDGKTALTSDSDELARLRKSSEDLLRLRNEVSQLRKENQQLSAQVQSAQAQAQGAQAQFQALRTNLGPNATRSGAAQPGGTSCVCRALRGDAPDSRAHASHRLHQQPALN